MPHIGMQTEYDQIIGGSELMQTMVDTNPLGEMIQRQVRSETEKYYRIKLIEGILLEGV